MKKLILLIVLAFFVFSEGYSQSSLWSKTTEQKLAILEKLDRDSSPKEFELFHLNVGQLKSQLSASPSRDLQGSSQVVISFPNAEGKLEKFKIYESSVMAPELAKRHSEIQSYIGVGIDDPTASMSITTTIFGVHAMVLSVKGTYYIDPFTKDLNNYIVYNKSSLSTTNTYQCLVHDEDKGEFPNFEQAILASDSKFRTYRMAMACTIEYAAFHIAAAGVTGADLATRKAAVLAAMNVTVARLNLVYEKDMSLRMQLVANNEDIIFIDTDNFNNTAPGTLINQSQTVIDGAIGSANYDIGHTVSTGGGGLAQSPSVCLASGKARGITGSPAPVGDPYDIDFVAHEVGHQFGASHTFNGEGGNCTALGTSPTRSAANAVEPGSGSTIMAYAGICSPVDVQSNSDSYFHAVSIAQMVTHINGSGNCVAGVLNNNTPPTIGTFTNYAIPAGTAFVLKGTATDVDGDVLSYCWEQTNAGTTTDLPNATTTSSIPNFRSFNPTTSPNRYFPALSTVLSGSLATTWEVIPTVARTMNFALTVRDNRTPNGGQTSRRNMTIVFNADGAPFAVTSQNTDGLTFTQGQSQTVTWNVGNTTVAPINTSNVNILLSTDGGLTFSTVLASNTPNDGTEIITLPNVAGLNCRIMVEAVGNVFYAVNSKAFSIGYNCNIAGNATQIAIPDGTGTTTPGAESIINVTSAGTVNDIKITVNATHSRIGNLRLTLIHPDGTSVILMNRACNAAIYSNMAVSFQNGAPTIVCSSPLSGTYRASGTLANLNGKSITGNWTLRVQDFATGDTGTLDSWSLNLGCTLGNEEVAGLADFKIYPNPNKGNFTIQFDSKSGNEIKVGVNDISGRQIFNRSYQNTGLFSENLKLDNLQSGIYLVTVQDGDRREVKKIVVE